MTFEIIKPVPVIPSPKIDVPVVKAAIIAGMKDGTITTLHDAVTVATIVAGTSLNGGQVNPFFRTLLKELKSLNSKAAELIDDGNTALEVEAGLDKIAENFLPADIVAYREETYGVISEVVIKEL